jgi:hypothetical protein
MNHEIRWNQDYFIGGGAGLGCMNDLVVDQWSQKVRATRTAIPCGSTTVRRRFVA